MTAMFRRVVFSLSTDPLLSLEFTPSIASKVLTARDMNRGPKNKIKKHFWTDQVMDNEKRLVFTSPLWRKANVSHLFVTCFEALFLAGLSSLTGTLNTEIRSISSMMKMK